MDSSTEFLIRHFVESDVYPGIIDDIEEGLRLFCSGVGEKSISYNETKVSFSKSGKIELAHQYVDQSVVLQFA